MERFVDPYTKQYLEKDPETNLYYLPGDTSKAYKCLDGCCDFVVKQNNVEKTRECYDEAYAEKGECYSDMYSKADSQQLSLATVTEPWHDNTVPWRKTMLASLGEITGKRVLLLGNGNSCKEFYFLHLGAHIVYTDLSLEAVRRAKSLFRRSELWGKYRDKIEFHAVDAMHLPFCDGTFDIIYGSKFVGFLDNHTQFFSEVYRCLKTNGRCRFADDAYSSLWDSIKRTVLRPVQKRLLRSPTALDRLRGEGSESGFREEYLSLFKEQYGFKKLIFVREYFFLRITQLVYGKMVHWNPKHLRLAKPFYLLMKWIDIGFRKANWVKKNALALTWGLDK